MNTKMIILQLKRLIYVLFTGRGPGYLIFSVMYLVVTLIHASKVNKIAAYLEPECRQYHIESSTKYLASSYGCWILALFNFFKFPKYLIWIAAILTFENIKNPILLNIYEFGDEDDDDE